MRKSIISLLLAFILLACVGCNSKTVLVPQIIERRVCYGSPASGTWRPVDLIYIKNEFGGSNPAIVWERDITSSYESLEDFEGTQIDYNGDGIYEQETFIRILEVEQ